MNLTLVGSNPDLEPTTRAADLDVLIREVGDSTMLILATPRAGAWVDASIEYDYRRRHGLTLSVASQDIGDIISAMLLDGLQLEEV